MDRTNRLALTLGLLAIASGCGTTPELTIPAIEGATPVDAEATFLLPALASGQRFEFEWLMESDADNANFVQGTAEVVRVEGGIPVEVRFDFGECWTHFSGVFMNLIVGDIAMDASGKSMTLEMTDDGVLKVSGGGDANQTWFILAAVQGLIAPPPHLPPTPRAVGPGDSWETDLPGWIQSGDWTADVSCRSRFDSVVAVGDRRLVQLSADKTTAARALIETVGVGVGGGVQPQTMSIAIDAVEREQVLWDLEDGVVAEATGEGSWTQESPGVDSEYEATVQWRLRRISRRESRRAIGVGATRASWFPRAPPNGGR